MISENKMNDDNQTFLLSHLLILAKKKRVIIITDFISHFCESKNKKNDWYLCQSWFQQVQLQWDNHLQISMSDIEIGQLTIKSIKISDWVMITDIALKNQSFLYQSFTFGGWLLNSDDISDQTTKISHRIDTWYCHGRLY